MTQNRVTALAGDVNAIVKQNGIDAAIEYLDKYIQDNVSDEAYYLRGRLRWKLGRRTDAMSDYSSAVAINPESEASAALDMARDIMDFFNHDLYNP